MNNSQTCPPSPPIPRVRRRIEEEPTPSAHNGANAGDGNLQAPSALAPCTARVEGRPPRGTQPRTDAGQETSETHKGPLAREDRTAAGRQRRPALRLAVRRSAVASEAIRGWGPCSHYGSGHVSALAHQAAHWSVVSEHGNVGTHWVVFRDGNFPPNTILCDGLYGQAWPLAVS